jgi:hypothetical protein
VTDEVVILEREPQAEAEQPEPERDQETPLLSASFWSEAVKPADWEIWTEAEEGLRETEMGKEAGEMAMLAEADLEESAMEVAVSVTVAGEGTEEGAS